jgi:hypothetical protein
VGSMDETRCSPPSRAAISSTLVAHARPFRFAQSCAAIATTPSGRTPGAIGSLVSDPLNQNDFVGWKRGPLGLFLGIGSRNQRFEPHHPISNRAHGRHGVAGQRLLLHAAQTMTMNDARAAGTDRDIHIRCTLDSCLETNALAHPAYVRSPYVVGKSFVDTVVHRPQLALSRRVVVARQVQCNHHKQNKPLEQSAQPRAPSVAVAPCSFHLSTTFYIRIGFSQSHVLPSQGLTWLVKR